MESLRLVEGKVKLELSNQIYRFIKAITDYEMFITEQEFEMDLPEINDSPRFKLLRPFKDSSMLRRDIKEFAWVIGVDSQMNGLFVDLLSIGDVNRTIVEPWAPFRGTFVVAASAIILAHNHPSGNVRPSENDIKLTKMTIGGELSYEDPCWTI